MLVAVWGYFIVNEPAATSISETSEVTHIDTDELIAQFQNNENEANAALVEKVIEVKGVIKDISFLNNRHTILLKSKSFSKNFVMCDMSPLGNQEIGLLAIGDTITLRGVCKGYLLDVIMLNCMPVNEKP